MGEHLAKRDVGTIRLCGGGHLIADVGLCQPVESNAVGRSLDVERESGLAVQWVGAGGQFLAVGHAVAVRIVGQCGVAVMFRGIKAVGNLPAVRQTVAVGVLLGRVAAQLNLAVGRQSVLIGVGVCC